MASSSISFGFEFDPEYRSIMTSRGFQMLNPSQIDSEYQSDVLTYSVHPRAVLMMSRARLQSLGQGARTQSTASSEGPSFPVHGSAFVSAGSLSATQFDQKQRAEVMAHLSDAIRFRFLRTEDENYEEASLHSIVELDTRLISGPLGDFSFIAYGELSRQKREDDLGFAMGHKFFLAADSVIESRVFLNLVDFTRSERNDLADRFEQGAEPKVYGWVSRWFRPDEVIEGFLRVETPLRWNDPSRGQIFGYRNTVVGGQWVRTKDRLIEQIRFQYDVKSTSLTSISDRSITAFERERLAVEARKGFAVSDEWVFDAGVQWVSRNYKNAAGALGYQTQFLPFMWLNHFSGLEVGVEGTQFVASGDRSFFAASLRTEAIESRLNARYRIPFSGRGELALALTFDIDRGEGGTFEGGHGQFTFGF